MENIFIKAKKNKNKDLEIQEILKNIQEIKMRLDYDELCLNFTSYELLIDSTIYEIMSLQKKYAYYFKKIKKKGVVIENLDILQKFPVL